jgi:multidrug resistance protein, MATE family
MPDADLPRTPRAWRRRVWALSWPVVLSNATVPLVGAVDTAVVGQLPDPAYIGAVAIGALIFTFIAWVFGFLRMSTTGFIAQAWGADDLGEVSATTVRALILALLLALSLILFQLPVREFAFWSLGASAEVESLASQYYHVRIWSVPAAMIHLVTLGTLFGLQRMRAAFATQLVLNGLNMALDMLFVRGFGWGVPGVALATVLGEYTAAALGMWLVWRSLRGLACPWPRHGLLDRRRLIVLFQVNANLMVRTLCVQLTFFYFTSTGARLGNVMPAANAVLLHFVHIMTFGVDGFAHAAEALAGRAYGAGDRTAFRAALTSTMISAAGVAVCFSLIYLVAGRSAISLMTGLESVRSVAYTYLPWVVLAPLVSVWAYLLDGIYLGATRTTEMRNGMLIALAVYLLCVWVSLPLLGNHGLWLSMIVFLIARGVTLGCWYPRIERRLEHALPGHR